MSQTTDFDQAPKRVATQGGHFLASYQAVEPLAATLDALLIVIVSVLTGVGSRWYFYDTFGDIDLFLGVGIVTALLHVTLIEAAGLYRFSSLLSMDRRVLPIATRWLAALTLLTLLIFLLKIGTNFSRASTMIFAVVGLPVLLGSRTITTHLLQAAIRRQMVVGRRAVIIGERDELSLISSSELLTRFGISELGRVSLRKSPHDENISLALRQREQAAVGYALDLARRNLADEIVLAIHWSDRRRLDLVRQELRQSPLPVRLLPDSSVRSVMSLSQRGIAAGALVEVQRGPLTLSEQLLKRLFDIALAGAAIFVLSPLLVLVAIAIKLDSPGPVIFRQRRSGFNDRPFMIFKFRTMSVLEDGPVIRQAMRQDPRVTRIGKWLRRTSIDELPQLFNVIRGDMSVIGPRPHALAHDDVYSAQIATYAIRHHVKPGITGWAQTNGCRGETRHVDDMRKRVDLDLWYINNWSVWLDVRILLRTALTLLRSELAY